MFENVDEFLVVFCSMPFFVLVGRVMGIIQLQNLDTGNPDPYIYT